MRTLILLATSSALFAASLPAWACGMPPRDELVLADSMALIDQLLVPSALEVAEVVELLATPVVRLPTVQAAPLVATPLVFGVPTADAPVVPPAPPTGAADSQS